VPWLCGQLGRFTICGDPGTIQSSANISSLDENEVRIKSTHENVGVLRQEFRLPGYSLSGLANVMYDDVRFRVFVFFVNAGRTHLGVYDYISSSAMLKMMILVLHDV
jgi:hypothetical protein